MIDRFGDLALPNGRPVAAEALWLIGLYSLQAGRYTETVAAADALVRRYKAAESLEERLASALVNKARALDRLERPDEQVKTLREIVAQFGASETEEVRQLVGLSMFQLGAVLKSLGARDQAVSVWSDLFERFRDAPPRDAPRLPFRAQAATVETLVNDALIDEALAAAEDLMETMRAGQQSSVVAEIGNALIRSGRALERAGELQKALEVFECASQRLLQEPDHELKTVGVHAEINVGVIRGRLGDNRGACAAMEAIVGAGAPALAALDAIIQHAGESSAGIRKEREPWALLLKGLVLEDLGRVDEAQRSFAEVVERFRAGDSPTVQLLVAAAHEALARASE